MPKYFFYVTDGQDRYKNRDGIVLSDNEAARKHATQIAADLAKDEKHTNFYVLALDESGERVTRVDVTPRH